MKIWSVLKEDNIKVEQEENETKDLSIKNVPIMININIKIFAMKHFYLKEVIKVSLS